MFKIEEVKERVLIRRDKSISNFLLSSSSSSPLTSSGTIVSSAKLNSSQNFLLYIKKLFCYFLDERDLRKKIGLVRL